MNESEKPMDRFKWTESDSILSKNIEPRPVLEDISIIIPTLGRPILEQSLYWIATGNSWPGCLIIVEQGNNPDVILWLNYLNSLGISVKHIRSEKRGRSAGINTGLDHVETRFITVTDDDCFVSEDWLENIYKYLNENPETIVTGRVEAAGEDVLLVVTSMKPAIHRRPRLKFDSMSGGNMGTSISVIQRVGFFNEDPCMKTAEDAEWGYRALCTGIPIIYAPNVCLWHFGWRDPAKRFEQYRGYALSHGGFYGKYLRHGDLFIFLRTATHMIRALRRWIAGTLSGKDDIALMGRSYFLYIPSGILAGFKSQFQGTRGK